MIFQVLSLLMLVLEATSSDITCAKWAATAAAMSGNGRLQKCVSNATKVCTRFDCQGSLTERLAHIVEIDYCFGLQLNSCLDPLSMDFYLNIPSHNSSVQFRISHDRQIYLDDLNLPFLKNLPLKPLLDFEFERDDKKDSVLISVTFKMRTSFAGLYVDSYERKIVDEEEVPIHHCDSPLIVDKTLKPPENFVHTFACHPQKYPIKPATLVPAVHIKPSETLNKTCNLERICSQGETCELTSGVEGKCVCEPDYLYNDKFKVCLTQGSVGLECEYDGQCGVYEECRWASPTSQKSKCQCEDSFVWDLERQICVLNSRNNPSPSKGGDHSHKSKDDADTTASPKEPQVKDKAHSAGSSNNKYVIIAASSVGAVVVVAATIAGILLCRRRRRRNQFVTGGNLYDNHDSPMLNDTDDDVDLVM